MAHVQQKAETTQLVYFSSCLKLIHFSRLILSLHRRFFFFYHGFCVFDTLDFVYSVT